MDQDYTEKKHALYKELRGSILGTTDDINACLSPDRKTSSSRKAGIGVSEFNSPPNSPNRRNADAKESNRNNHVNNSGGKQYITNSPNKNSSSKLTGNSPPATPNKISNSNNTAINICDPKYEEQLRAERDKRIQLEIKQLHMETIKLERVGKEQFIQERKNIIHHKEIEENQLKNHIKQLNQSITDIIIE